MLKPIYASTINIIKKYLLVHLATFMMIPCVFAGTQPKYTMTPLSVDDNPTPHKINLLLNANATVQYRIVNNTKKISPPLYIDTNIPGVRPLSGGSTICTNPFQLTPGASCILNLQVHANALGTWSGLDGLTIHSGEGTVQVRPSAKHLLQVQVSTYSNLYIAYLSANSANDIARYVVQNALAGMFIWEARGDAPYSATTPTTSLLGTIKPTLLDGGVPFLMGYWSNWSVYTNSADRAIPAPAYPIPNSLSSNNTITTNSDLNAKLEGLNYLTYAFLEAQAANFTYTDSVSGTTYTIANKTPNKIGTIYFNDPWADLSQPSTAAGPQNAFCGPDTNPVCSYALQNRNTPIPLQNGAFMGNFGAFANLAHAGPNALGPLKKMISIGGYGHNDSYEDMFNACPDGTNCINNFVTSATNLINAYHLDGIDLDYENPDLSHDNSQKFATLVEALQAAMPNKTISVTLLSDPAYLAGTRVCSASSPTRGQAVCGFAPGTLGAIDAKATHINLMTYDFYGAFSYPGSTAFLTNLNAYSSAGTSTLFSIVSAVNAAHEAGVTLAKLSVGIPAYGRALAGIDATNGGLLQTIPSTAIIPRGDLDTASCSQSITSGNYACSGSFQYSYILDNMLASPNVSPGLTQTEYTGGATPVAGTTAYGASWSPPASPTLTIINGGPANSNHLAFKVMIGTANPHYFLAPDYISLGSTYTYQSSTYNAGSNTISDGNLSINWTTDFAVPPQISGTCPQVLPPLTKNTIVTITVNNQGTQTCQVTQ